MSYLQIRSCLNGLFLFALISFLTIPSSQAESINSGITLSNEVHSSERLYTLPGLSNVGRVAPGVLSGAQPGKDGYATLKAMGVKT